MTAVTFGQLVQNQVDSKESQESLEIAAASNWEIPFGKHKGMTLSLLMEQQAGYCNWIVTQDPSKNEAFNLTANYLKLLMAADQAEMDGGVVVAIDPSSQDGDTHGIYVVKNPDYELPLGFISGLVSDLLKQVNENDLTFNFNSTDVNIWLKLVKELQENEVDVFLMIETTVNKTHPQRIKRVF